MSLIREVEFRSSRRYDNDLVKGNGNSMISYEELCDALERHKSQEALGHVTVDAPLGEHAHADSAESAAQGLVEEAQSVEAVGEVYEYDEELAPELEEVAPMMDEPAPMMDEPAPMSDEPALMSDEPAPEVAQDGPHGELDEVSAEADPVDEAPARPRTAGVTLAGPKTESAPAPGADE